jgi:hypothetical protein
LRGLEVGMVVWTPSIMNCMGLTDDSTIISNTNIKDLDFDSYDADGSTTEARDLEIMAIEHPLSAGNIIIPHVSTNPTCIVYCLIVL